MVHFGKFQVYHGLDNHNKKFHTNNENIIIEDENKIKCDYCNKYYYNKYTLKTHENICSIKKFNTDKNNNINNNIKNI